MYLRKTLSLLLVFCLVLINATPAYAQETKDEELSQCQIGIEVINKDDINFHKKGHFGIEHELNGSSRGLSIPTSFHDLSTEVYCARLTSVGSNRLYTNKYFIPDLNGEIYTDFEIRSDAFARLEVGIYDITTRQSASQFFSFDTITSSWIRFYNLSTTHDYAVFFRSDNGEPMYSGNATIYHIEF